MHLLIGNKNYSSWSLRPWLLLKQIGVEFAETKLSFNDPQFSNLACQHSPTGKVPLLTDGEIKVWDSLAICEYLAERFPDKGVWPTTVHARAMARSICAEMHSSFGAMRSHMPMNIEASLPGMGWNTAVQRDIDRIAQIWSACLHASGGPFLFGHFCAADAYYAPVCMRFISHEVKLDAMLMAYVHRIQQLPAMQLWIHEAKTEHDYVAADEPYRSSN